MRRFLQNRAAVLCAAIVIAVALMTIVGPWIAAGFGLDAVTQNAQLGATPPSAHHPLGTDVLGRDLLVRVLVGGRVALRVALLGAGLAVLLGVAWGAVAGLAGGRVDELMMRVVDLLYSLPQIVFVMVVMAIAASRSEALLLGLIAGVSWLTMARIVRVEVLALRASPHVLAARGLGAGAARLLRRHILPNAAGTVVVYSTLLVPSVMLQEAFLSFLGLGVQPPNASWGTLVHEGVAELVVYPWILAGPAAMMAITIFALNFVGDGLRDALDPRA